MAAPDEPLTDYEQRVVARIHEARASVRAPASLRQRIDAQRPSRVAQSRRRLGYSAAFAASLAAVAVALALILPSGTPGSPTVSEAAALALRGANLPAPEPDASAPNVQLRRDVGNVYFPNWDTRFHWRAIGQRSDTLGGHQAVTVYYVWAGREVAYTIVAAPPLGAPTARATTINGTEYRTLTIDGRLTVTWRRSGHTCVLSSTGGGVSGAALRELAAWQAPRQARS